MMMSARSMIAPFDPVAEWFDELAGWPIFDPHSHIDPHRPAARNLNEIRGYHYYTELAHATGMPADRVCLAFDPRTRSLHLAEYLERIDNTVDRTPGSWRLHGRFTFSHTTGSIPRRSATFTTVRCAIAMVRSGIGRSEVLPAGSGFLDQRLR